MRCFVAIPLPKRVKRELIDLQQPIKKLRWQKMDQFHLTLKFLGDVSGDNIEALQTELSNIKRPAFSLSLEGFGYFPKGKNPRVLWAGIEENSALKTLRDKVEKKCVSAGFEAEERPFKPHITLGRMKGASKSEVMEFINQHKQFEISDIPIDKFVLYQSKLHPEGAEYIELKTFRLNK